MSVFDAKGFSIDVNIVGSLAAEYDATLEELAQAAMAAADSVESWGKRKLRSDTERGLGPRVARTWRSKVYPSRRGQASIAPSVTWWTNAPHIVRAFSEGINIRSSEGFWLAIPTQNAPQTGRTFGANGRLKRGRAHAITEAERRFGRLRYVAVPGKELALLVADKVRKRTGKRKDRAHTRYTGASPTAIKKGNYEDGVVMFILVPSANMPKSINPARIEREIGEEGVRRFAEAFKDVADRNFAKMESFQ